MSLGLVHRSALLLLRLLVVNLLTAACALASPEPVVQAPPSPRPTLAVPPTWTPAPTETPAPTRTPRPTSDVEYNLGAPITPTVASGDTPLVGKLVFSASPDSRWENLYTINEDGTGFTQLTEGPGVRNRWPSLSPDGTQIVFVSDRVNEMMDIYVMQV
ncbi:MAG: PD40 domain-containing protein, partial [Ardenticatenales bacterium]|nr:PD40 domain-containing protein [Ardenticatenales bacterium]